MTTREMRLALKQMNPRIALSKLSDSEVKLLYQHPLIARKVTAYNQAEIFARLRKGSGGTTEIEEMDESDDMPDLK